MTRDAKLFAELMASEESYFSMGAQLTEVDGAEIAIMREFASQPAGAVVHRVDTGALKCRSSNWISHVEQVLKDGGANLSRIYVADDCNQTSVLLDQCDYQPRIEIGFAGEIMGETNGMVLSPISNDHDWYLKAELHSAIGSSPDGHLSDGRDFVSLERAKSRSGLDSYLAQLGEKTVGSIGAVWGDGFVRAKNLVVHPDSQRHGIGSAMLAALNELARQRGIKHVGAFGIEGGAGSALYRNSGLDVVGSQTEWSKRI